MKALRDLLLYHVDDLEDILEALQKRPELGPGDLPEIGRMWVQPYRKRFQS